MIRNDAQGKKNVWFQTTFLLSPWFVCLEKKKKHEECLQITQNKDDRLLQENIVKQACSHGISSAKGSENRFLKETHRDYLELYNIFK